MNKEVRRQLARNRQLGPWIQAGLPGVRPLQTRNGSVGSVRPALHSSLFTLYSLLS